LVQTVWTAKSGPNLDQIWTKSGPNLDTIWTGFLKMNAEIPDKILRPRTVPLTSIYLEISIDNFVSEPTKTL
jgi:hypothetical protein